MNRLLPFVLAALLWPAARATFAAGPQQVGFDQRLGEAIPLDLGFRDESGAPVRLERYFHRAPVVLALVYFECPNLCGVSLNGLFRSLHGVGLRPGRNYQALVVSIDPHEGSRLAAAKKRSYIQHYGEPGERPAEEQGWHFLTGNEASIAHLAQAVGFRYRYDPDLEQYIHPSGVVVVTPEGTISRYLFGVELAPQDLRLATVEASGGRVGTLSDAFWLLCSHYDPATGRYTEAVTEAMRALGAVVVVSLAGLIGMLAWRERGRERSMRGLRRALDGEGDEGKSDAR